MVITGCYIWLWGERPWFFCFFLFVFLDPNAFVLQLFLIFLLLEILNCTWITYAHDQTTQEKKQGAAQLTYKAVKDLMLFGADYSFILLKEVRKLCLGDVSWKKNSKMYLLEEH